MIEINKNISIDENNFIFETFRSSGPGGQNVNKVSSAVRLRFNLSEASFSDQLLDRIKKLAGKKLTQENEILIEAQRFRNQEKNKQDAIVRLVKLLRKAVEKPKKRVRTKPTKESKEKRISNKKRKGELKNGRSKIKPE